MSIKKRKIRKPKESFSKRVGMLFIKLFLGVLALAFVIGFGLFLGYRSTHLSSFSSEQIVIAYDNLDEYGSSIYLVKIFPDQSQIEVFVFPSDVKIDVIGGYGEYELRALYPLTKIEKMDDDKTVAVLSFALSSSIHQVWTTDSDLAINQESEVRNLATKVLQGKVHTQWGILQKIKFYQWLGSLRPDQIKVKSFDSIEQWTQYQSGFSDSQLFDCSVSVVNATQVAGLAKNFSTVLENSGAYVVRVTDMPEKALESSILISKDSTLCQESLNMALNIMPFSEKIEESEDLYETYRSDLVFILGEDLGEFLEKD